MSKINVTQSMRLIILSAIVVMSFGAAGEICGTFDETIPVAFDVRFADNDLKQINTALKGFAKPHNPTKVSNSQGKNIVVMVVNSNPKELVAWDISLNRALWRKKVNVRSGLYLKQDLLIFREGDHIAAWNLVTGEPQWEQKIEEGWAFLGADVDGDVAALSIGVGSIKSGPFAAGRVICVDADSGRKQWEHNSGGGLLGGPAVSGEYVLVPWDQQKIVVLEADSGDEVCRLRAKDFPINFVKAHAAGVFYGSVHGGKNKSMLFKFDEEAAKGNREGINSFVPGIKPVPGDPSFWPDSFVPMTDGRYTEEKIRFHYEPVIKAGTPIALADNAYYLHYWRYIISFDADSNEIKWVYISDKTIESMAVVTGGVMAADIDGNVLFLDAKAGKEMFRQATQNNILTAVFDTHGFNPGSSNATPDSVNDIKKLIVDNDNRMLPIRIYAVHLLAMLKDKSVTKDLLDIHARAEVVTKLRDELVIALSNRSVGSEYMSTALDVHYDFLEQTQSPPMNVVAPALVSMKDSSAAPKLVAHLVDHETAITTLEDIAYAIRKLGGPNSVEPLKKFLTLYRADTSFLGYETALGEVASAIFIHSGKKEKAYLENLRDDVQTLPELRKLLIDVIDPGARAAAEAKAKAAKEAALAKEREKLIANKELPQSLERTMINKAIKKHQAVLRPCIKGALEKRAKLSKVRLRFMILGANGKAINLQILPGDIPGLYECLKTNIGKIPFPKFKNIKQSASYTINIKSKWNSKQKQSIGTDSKDDNAPAENKPESLKKPASFDQ